MAIERGGHKIKQMRQSEDILNSEYDRNYVSQINFTLLSFRYHSNSATGMDIREYEYATYGCNHTLRMYTYVQYRIT